MKRILDEEMEHNRLRNHHSKIYAFEIDRLILRCLNNAPTESFAIEKDDNIYERRSTEINLKHQVKFQNKD